MKLLSLVAVIGLAGCGGATTVTVTATSSTAPTTVASTATLQPADASLPAECQPEPNAAPSCTQGSGVPVQPISAGQSCSYSYGPASGSATWQSSDTPNELNCKPSYEGQCWVNNDTAGAWVYDRTAWSCATPQVKGSLCETDGFEAKRWRALTGGLGEREWACDAPS